MRVIFGRCSSLPHQDLTIRVNNVRSIYEGNRDGPNKVRESGGLVKKALYRLFCGICERLPVKGWPVFFGSLFGKENGKEEDYL